MRRDDVLKTLQELEFPLRRQYYVRSLEIFGSVAREDDTGTSDIDLLVDFDRPIGLLHLIGTEQYLEQALAGSRVDLVMRNCVIPELRTDIWREKINVFEAPEVEVSRSAHARGG